MSPDTFNQYRPLLFSIAYRMLGTVMDAEDMVQETFLRWQKTDERQIQSPKAYLTSIITRLCIDYLRSAQAQRESYLGPWLPEPLISQDTTGAAEIAVLSESLSMAFLVLLEKLSPLERAVFLLREVFDYDYKEIAEMVGKSEANCRQLVRRARQHVSDGRPRFESSPAEQQELTIHFAQACTTGDLNSLLHILAEDITLWSDGGGKVSAARKPVFGSDKVARFILGLMKKAPPDLSTRFALVNGEPGFINYIGGRPTMVLTLEVGNGRIQAIRVVANPDKLKAIPPL